MRSTILSLALIVAAACGPVPFGSATDDQPLLSGPTVVAPTSGFGDPSTVTTIDAQGNVNWVGGSWYVPLPVSAGDVIGTVTAPVRDNGTANGHSSDGNNVLVNLISRVQTSNPANPIDTSRAFWASNGSGNQQTATLTPSGGYTVQAGDEMLVVFSGLKGGALPGPSTVPSMSGAVTVGPPVTPPAVRTRVISGLTAVPEVIGASSPAPGASRIGSTWIFASRNLMYFPVPVIDTEIIDGFKVWITKGSDASTSITSTLREADCTTGVATVLATVSTSANAPGSTTLSTFGISYPVRPAHSYFITIADSNGGLVGTSDTFTDAALSVR